MTNGQHQELVEFLAGKFEGIDQRFDTVDRPFDAVDRRFDAVDGRLGGVEERMPERAEPGFSPCSAWRPRSR